MGLHLRLGHRTQGVMLSSPVLIHGMLTSSQGIRLRSSGSKQAGRELLHTSKAHRRLQELAADARVCADGVRHL
jgi:hypothetical protein